MNCMLITGGCGFIGSNFIRLAMRELPNCRVINLDKLTYAGNPLNLTDIEQDSRYRFVNGDICDAALVAQFFSEEHIDTVVHLAAESHVDRSIAGPEKFPYQHRGNLYPARSGPQVMVFQHLARSF